LHRAADRPESRDVRELEAEAVAFVVGEAIGLRVGEAARDYIHLYRGDRNRLVASMDRIRAAATTIINSIDPAPRGRSCTAANSDTLRVGVGHEPAAQSQKASENSARLCGERNLVRTNPTELGSE
jgi:hypothetical protein